MIFLCVCFEHSSEGKIKKKPTFFHPNLNVFIFGRFFVSSCILIVQKDWYISYFSYFIRCLVHIENQFIRNTNHKIGRKRRNEKRQREKTMPNVLEVLSNCAGIVGLWIKYSNECEMGTAVERTNTHTHIHNAHCMPCHAIQMKSRTSVSFWSQMCLILPVVCLHQHNTHTYTHKAFQWMNQRQLVCVCDGEKENSRYYYWFFSRSPSFAI